jgi:hypothetical protein
MQPAAIGARQKAARAVGSRSDAIVAAPSGDRLEWIPIRAFSVAAGFAKPARDATLREDIALGGGDEYVPPPAATAT